MRNKIHSDLVYEYKQCVGRIRYYLRAIKVEKNEVYDSRWTHHDLEGFLILKRQTIGSYRESLSDLVKQSKDLKSRIKYYNSYETER